MTTWTRRPGRQRIEDFALFFALVDIPGGGFGFPCDKDGRVVEAALTDLSRKTLAECRSGSVDGAPVQAPVLQDFSRDYYDPGAVRCGCGHVHELERGDSACERCGQWRNASGQELVDPRHWDD